MAINLKGKKTKLDERASIYVQRDEGESEKSRWGRMNWRERLIHLKTYYLRIAIIAVVVAAVAGYFIYHDVFLKRETIYHCALINEMAKEVSVDALADDFTMKIGFDPSRNMTSFHLYYTDTELANQVGATTAADLTQVSSMIYAASLDSVIAGAEDFAMYLENGFFVDLTEFLTAQELEKLQDYLYVPEGRQNPDGHPYGIILGGNEVYRKMFENGGGIVEKPIFGVVFNSENKERSRQLLYYFFPQLGEIPAGTEEG